MSWIPITALIVTAGFAACCLLCEWLVRGRGGGGDDPSATG